MGVLQAEVRKIEHIKKIAEPFIAKAAKVDPVPWLAAAGPSTWEAYGKPRVPVYVLELDTTKVSAGKLVNDRHLLHDISTASGGKRFWWKNSLGLGLVYDERPIPKVNLVNALTESGCALIVGPRGTGKTTLLQHVIAHRSHRVIVCDPKPYAPDEGDKWLKAEVVGRNGDFQAIAEKLSKIEQVMNKGGFGERVLVIVDEYWITCGQVDIAKDVFRLVALGREPGIDIFIGTHSERVRGLGIEGEGDLRDAFDVVRLSKGFKATWDDGNGERAALHPGPFESTQVKSTQPVAKPEPKEDIVLSKTDRILVFAAVRKFNGEAPVNGIHKLIEQELPEEYWKPGTGAPLTYHKIAQKFRDWERQGLLNPPPQERNPDGSLKARQVTDRLKKLASLK